MKTNEQRAYDAASRRFIASVRRKTCPDALKARLKQRRALIWADWRDVLDTLIVCGGILLLAFLAFLAFWAF